MWDPTFTSLSCFQGATRKGSVGDRFSWLNLTLTFEIRYTPSKIKHKLSLCEITYRMDVKDTYFYLSLNPAK